MSIPVTLYRIHNHSFIPDLGPTSGYSFTPNQHREGSDDGPEQWILPNGYFVIDNDGELSLHGPDGYAGNYAHGSGIFADRKDGKPYIATENGAKKLYLTTIA